MLNTEKYREELYVTVPIFLRKNLVDIYIRLKTWYIYMHYVSVLRQEHFISRCMQKLIRFIQNMPLHGYRNMLYL